MSKLYLPCIVLAAVAVGSPGCPKGWNESGGTCVVALDGGKQWWGARWSCQTCGIGSELLTPSEGAVQALNGNGPWWTGLHVTPQGTWAWSNGERVDTATAPWAPEDGLCIALEDSGVLSPRNCTDILIPACGVGFGGCPHSLYLPFTLVFNDDSPPLTVTWVLQWVTPTVGRSERSKGSPCSAGWEIEARLPAFRCLGEADWVPISFASPAPCQEGAKISSVFCPSVPFAPPENPASPPSVPPALKPTAAPTAGQPYTSDSLDKGKEEQPDRQPNNKVPLWLWPVTVSSAVFAALLVVAYGASHRKHRSRQQGKVSPQSDCATCANFNTDTASQRLRSSYGMLQKEFNRDLHFVTGRCEHRTDEHVLSVVVSSPLLQSSAAVLGTLMSRAKPRLPRNTRLVVEGLCKFPDEETRTRGTPPRSSDDDDGAREVEMEEKSSPDSIAASCPVCSNFEPAQLSARLQAVHTSLRTAFSQPLTLRSVTSQHRDDGTHIHVFTVSNVFEPHALGALATAYSREKPRLPRGTKVEFQCVEDGVLQTDFAADPVYCAAQWQFP